MQRIAASVELKKYLPRERVFWPTVFDTTVTDTVSFATAVCWMDRCHPFRSHFCAFGRLPGERPWLHATLLCNDVVAYRLVPIHYPYIQIYTSFCKSIAK